MLTTSQKAHILARAGVAVPAFPARRLPVQERYLREGARVPQEELDADAEQRAAAERWNREIETLYVAHAAARAAKSLRDSEEAQQLDMLRRASNRPATTPPNDRTMPGLRDGAPAARVNPLIVPDTRTVGTSSCAAGSGAPPTQRCIPEEREPSVNARMTARRAMAKRRGEAAALKHERPRGAYHPVRRRVGRGVRQPRALNSRTCTAAKRSAAC
jgi:hypothetical protein